MAQLEALRRAIVKLRKSPCGLKAGRLCRHLRLHHAGAGASPLASASAGDGAPSAPEVYPVPVAPRHILRMGRRCTGRRLGIGPEPRHGTAT